MRRCIAVAIASSASLAVWATGAQALAAQPAWYSCLKAPKLEKAFTGAYEDSLCKTENAGHQGKYELVEGLGTKTKLSAKGGEVPGGAGSEISWEVSLPEGGALQWSCGAAKALGQLAGPNRVVGLTITLKGCGLTGAGQSPGVVVLGPLSGELGYLDEAHTQVGLDLAGEAETEGELAELTERATGAKFVLRGSMIGRLTGDLNKVGKVFAISWTGFPSFFEGPEDVLTMEQVSGKEELPPGEHPARLELGVKAKGPAVEVKTS
jgi:hypothetical protein